MEVRVALPPCQCESPSQDNHGLPKFRSVVVEQYLDSVVDYRVNAEVVAVIGTSGALAAARLTPFRLYFITGSVLLLGVGFWMAYRPQGGCIGKVCVTPSANVTRALLWMAALATAVAILLPNFVRG